MQRTLVLAKPDAVQRGLIGEIIGRFERKGLKVVGLRLLSVPREMAEEHYAVHAGKHFYDGLVKFITSGPVAAIALEGPDAIAVVRRMVGKTMPNEAEPGTIRGDLGVSGLRNLILLPPCWPATSRSPAWRTSWWMRRAICGRCGGRL